MTLQPTHVVSGSQCFRAADRVRQTRDFARSRAEGKRFSARAFSMELTRTVGNTRLGLVVSRRVGNAVVRNRVKRVVREWFRRSRAELPAGVDIVVVARGAAGTLVARECWTELRGLSARAAR